MSKTVPPPPSIATSAICGFDIGSENCYIAVARAGGIEILLNEYSQRSTPSYIGFGDKQRELGVSAKQKQMMNMSNTVYAPNRVIGRQYKELTEELPFTTEPSSTGEVSVKVWHNGEEMNFTATQIMAMLFTKLRHISSNSVDCVINCPIYFTDPQRRALMDAAIIAGLDPIRIIPDMTAIGLYYGFYRTAPSSQDVTIVAFVDSGHTSTQCAIILFNNKEHYMKVLSLEYEMDLGGKHFDEILANYFIQNTKLQMGKRAKYRLIAECEKLKKQMSANGNELPINIECLQDEQDFSGRMDRVLFEQLSEHILQRIELIFQRATQSAADKFMTDTNGKLGEFKIDSVEIVGGTSRIPAIKRLIKSVFGVEASTTLNADEAVARGCALQCAMLSPTFKVARQLQICDFAPYRIDFRYWHLSPEGNETDFKSVKELFPRGNQVPFTKQIVINCNSLPIIVAFDYVNDSNQTVPIGEFKITSLEPIQLSKNQMKLRVRLDPNGIVVINSASITVAPNHSKGVNNSVENQGSEDCEMFNENDKGQDQNNKNDTQSMETEAPEALQQLPDDGQNNAKDKTKDGGEEKKTKKPKATSLELIIETLWIRGKLSDTELQRFKEIELDMILADKNWKEKIDAKNALEEYVYEWRGKLEEGGYDPFVGESDKESFLSQLNSIGDWLYEQEDNGIIHSKSVYEEKLNQMRKTFSDIILYREREFTLRPSLLEQLGQRLQQARKMIEVGDIKTEGELLKKLDTEVINKQQWLDEACGTLKAAITNIDPPITTDQIKQQFDAIESVIHPLQNDRRRRIEEKKRKDEESNKQPPPPPPEQDPNHQPTETPPMEVDPEVHPTI